MSRSLDTLKTMGGAIKDETALQMVRSCARRRPNSSPRQPPARRHCRRPRIPSPAQRLLDDTGDKIDEGNTGLKRETARVDHVIKSSSTCWLYMLICLLIAVLVGLIIAYVKMYL